MISLNKHSRYCALTIQTSIINILKEMILCPSHGIFVCTFYAWDDKALEPDGSRKYLKGEVMSLYRVFYKDGSFERSLCSCF